MSNASSSLFPSVELSEIYDDRFAHVFKIILTVLGGTGSVISVSVMLIIFYQSPRNMRGYRNLLLGYTLCGLLLQLGSLICKPVILPIYFIVVYDGFIRTWEPRFVFALHILVVACITGMVMFFALMLTERYCAITGAPKMTLQTFYRHFKFYLVSIRMAMTVVLFVALGYCLQHVSFGDDVRYIFVQYIKNSEVFLRTDPGMFVINVKLLDFMAPIVLCIVSGYALMLAALILLTVSSYLKHRLKFSTKTREMHKMLIKVLLLQILGIVVFITLPLAVVAATIFSVEFKKYYYGCVLCIWTFPVCDSVVIISTIKPYRLYVSAFFDRLRRHPAQTSDIRVSYITGTKPPRT